MCDSPPLDGKNKYAIFLSLMNSTPPPRLLPASPLVCNSPPRTGQTNLPFAEKNTDTLNYLLLKVELDEIPEEEDDDEDDDDKPYPYIQTAAIFVGGGIAFYGAYKWAAYSKVSFRCFCVCLFFVFFSFFLVPRMPRISLYLLFFVLAKKKMRISIELVNYVGLYYIHDIFLQGVGNGQKNKLLASGGCFSYVHIFFFARDGVASGRNASRVVCLFA